MQTLARLARRRFAVGRGRRTTSTCATTSSAPPSRSREKVQAYVDAGCREFVLWFRDFPSSESLERFAEDVIPQIAADHCRVDASVTFSGRDGLLPTRPLRAPTAPGGRRPPSWVLVAGAVTVVARVAAVLLSRALRHVARRGAHRSTSRACRSATCASALRARRRAAALLRAAARLDRRVRHGRRRGALAVGRVHGRRGRRAVVRRRARFGGRDGAWLAVVVLMRRTRTRSATRPKRACTRSRSCSSRAGILAFQRALEQPTLGRLARVRRARRAARSTRSTGRSTSSASSVVLLVALAWRGAHRDAARRLLVAIGDRLARRSCRGCRRSCTSARTPARRGATPVLPGLPIGYTLRSASPAATSRKAGCSCSSCVALLLLGAVRRAPSTTATSRSTCTRSRRARWLGVRRRRHARGRRHAQLPRGPGVPVAVQRDRVPVLRAARRRAASRRSPTRGSGSARSRVIVGARVRRRRAQRRSTQRTQAGAGRARVASRRRSPATSSCTAPTSSGPRCTGSRPDGLDEVTYPDLRGAGVRRLGRLQEAARRGRSGGVRRGGGAGAPAIGTLWLVTGPGYPTHHGACEALSNQLATKRAVTQVVSPNDDFFEKPGLQEFAPPKQ